MSLSYATLKNMTRNSLLVRATLRHSKFSNIKRIYLSKQIYYGAYIENYDYTKVKVTFRNERESYCKKATGQKSYYSLARAREKIYRIVEGNIYRHGEYKPVFFTLTYKEGTEDVKQANRDIKAFIRRLNNHVGYSIRYIIVPERHISGLIHFHGVFFNLPFIDIIRFKTDIWKKGYVDLQVPKKIKKVSAYLAKYLSKDVKKNLDKNEKSYFSSRGLRYPQETYDSFTPHDTLTMEQAVPLKNCLKITYKKNAVSNLRKFKRRYK